MLIRLWWKEWRTLAPIAATLLGAAVGVQWFLLAYGGEGVRNGILIPVALGWAVLYALVAGSASFAGEREIRMLGFLDALPVGRGRLWLGKATFALASSLVLALVLEWIGSVGWVHSATAPAIALDRVVPFFALLLGEAVVWGLFWSALCRNAITAGICAVVTTGIMSATSGWTQNAYVGNEPFGSLSGLSVAWRGGAMVAALAVSWLTLNRELPGGPQTRWFAPIGRPDPSAVGSSETRARWRLLPTPAYWSIAWQTVREGRVTWLQSAALVGLATVLRLWSFDPGAVTVLAVLALVLQGASVFGLESAAGTRAFLDNQAVRSRTVWAAKVTPWVLGLAVPLGLYMVGLTILVGDRPGPSLWNNAWNEVSVALALVGDVCGVAMLGGMIFPRRITAVMISALVVLAVVVPQLTLLSAGMISPAGLLVSPLILVAASWFWTGDWLANRGRRRWVRLGGLIAIPFSLLVTAFIAGRAWGVPDIGPQFGAVDLRITPSDQGTAYRDAAATIDLQGASGDLQRFLELGEYASIPEVADYSLNRNQPVLERLRRIAAEPGMVVATDTPSTIFNLPKTTNAGVARRLFTPLLEADALDRRARGDFARSWDDLATLLRMSRQYAAGARSVGDFTLAMQITRRAVAQAVAWANDPKITVEVLEAARASLREIAAPPSAAEVLRFEAKRVERSLDRPTDDWGDFRTASPSSDPLRRIYTAWVVAPSWERERTRRLMRQIEAVAIGNAAAAGRGGETRRWVDDRSLGMPRRESAPPAGAIDIGGLYLASLPGDAPMLASLITPFATARNAADTSVAERRLLDTFLALRVHQLKHGGVAPGSLNELVPAELPAIPDDPFAAIYNLPLNYGADEDPNLGGAAMNEADIPQDPFGPPPPSALAGGQTRDNQPAATNPDGSKVTGQTVSRVAWAPTYRVYSIGPDGRGNSTGTLVGRPAALSTSDDISYSLPRNPMPNQVKP